MLSPVWFEWLDGGINIWVPTPEGGKVAHIQRDPRVSVVVYTSDWPYKGFELRGDATVSPEGFYDVLRRTALRYDGPEAAERMVASYAPGVVIQSNRARRAAGTTRTRPDRPSVAGRTAPPATHRPQHRPRATARPGENGVRIASRPDAGEPASGGLRRSA